MKRQACPWCKTGEVLECSPAANGSGWWCSRAYARPSPCDWQGEISKKGEEPRRYYVEKSVTTTTKKRTKEKRT